MEGLRLGEFARRDLVVPANTHVIPSVARNLPLSAAVRNYVIPALFRHSRERGDPEAGRRGGIIL